jgi:hypothetical protein
LSIGALVDPRGAWRLESGALWSSAWRLAAPHAGRNGGAQIRSGFAVFFGDSLDLDMVVGEEAPRATQALVVAQDVYLILGEATATDEAEVVRTPAQVLSEARRQRPRRRGTVLAGPRAGLTDLTCHSHLFHSVAQGGSDHVVSGLSSASRAH